MDLDIGWLLQCLERFIAGGKYGIDFYESNPPLSFLIYLPTLPLYSYLPISPQVSVLITFAGYMTIANFTIYKLFKHLDYEISEICIIIAALIIAQSWVAGISFGSKDHLIFVFLPAICLLQYMITINKKPSTAIMILAIIMGGIAICLKPYYAIVPALFFAHRLFISRSLVKTIISPDFIGMLIIGLLYLGFIYLFTPEYINIIMPELTPIYGLDKPFPIFTRLNYLIYAGIAAILGFFITKSHANNTKMQHVIFACVGLSIACTIPYYIQQKGFHYHAIPLLSFAMVALFLGCFATAKTFLRHNDLSLWVACAVIAVLSLSFTTGGKYKYLTNGQFTAQPLVETIDDLAWNKTYATYDMKQMLSALPYISNLKNGSRFGHIWGVHGLSIKMKTVSDEQEKQAIKAQMLGYVDMMAQDMLRYKPSVIIIPRYSKPNTNDNNNNNNYLKFLMSSESFKNSMQNYIFEASIPFDTTLTGTSYDPEKIVVHDVYVLKEDHNFINK